MQEFEAPGSERIYRTKVFRNWPYSRLPRGDLNTDHEHPRLRTRKTVCEKRSRSVREHETVANQSQTSQTVHEQGYRPSKHHLGHS